MTGHQSITQSTIRVNFRGRLARPAGIGTLYCLRVRDGELRFTKMSNRVARATANAAMSAALGERGWTLYSLLKNQAC